MLLLRLFGLFLLRYAQRKFLALLLMYDPPRNTRRATGRPPPPRGGASRRREGFYHTEAGEILEASYEDQKKIRGQRTQSSEYPS